MMKLMAPMLLIVAAMSANAQLIPLPPPDLTLTPTIQPTPTPAVQKTAVPAMASVAVIRPQIQLVIRAVPVQSQVAALEAEKRRLQSSGGLSDAMFYLFEALPNVAGAVKDPNAKYSPPIEPDRRERMDIHKAVFLIQKQIDEIKNGPEWAYLKYHERMRKLGVTIDAGVEVPKAGETRMWPREPDTAVMTSGESNSAPIQMRDCSPLIEQYREWVLMPVRTGFDERSGEALYNWTWQPFPRERSVSRPGC
jgi:hypothetical protein